jgi:uncharacterized membrane protein
VTVSTRTLRWLLFLLSLSISLVAARYFFLPLTKASGGNFGRHLADHGLVLYAHAGGGAVALLIGALQWLLTSRTRRSVWHRFIGRTYVIAIAVSGLSGLVIAQHAFGGFPARAGFAALAVAWLVSTSIAFTRVRAREWTSHRTWMIRSFALTFAAVTLRLWLPMLSLAGVSFDVAYPWVAWLCWVPNLLLVEWLISRERRKGLDRWERSESVLISDRQNERRAVREMRATPLPYPHFQ